MEAQLCLAKLAQDLSMKSETHTPQPSFTFFVNAGKECALTELMIMRTGIYGVTE